MKWKKQQMDEVFFLSEDQMSMHGILYKKGGNLVKKYKKRWFELPANSLSLQYFSAPNTKLHGHIDINEILDVSPMINNKKQLHGMKITTSHSRVYELYAKSPEERDAWCNGLLSRLRLIARSKVAVRDAMLTRFTPPLLQDATTSTSFIREYPIHGSRTGFTSYSSSEQLGTSITQTNDGIRTISTTSLRNGRGTPITISDDNTHFKMNIDAATRAYEEGHTPRATRSDSTHTHTASDSTASIADHLSSKVTRLEYLCAEKDATIAALHAMLDRQNEQKARANVVSYSPITAKNRVQQHIDEFVEIGKWLEHKKKTDLEKDSHRLREQNEQLEALLDEERQKNHFLEREKYNMQCMIEHLEREKFVS